MSVLMAAKTEFSLSIVIPTYNRGELLIKTLNMLLHQDVCPDQILVMDQTVYEGKSAMKEQLKEMNTEGKIDWHQLKRPSIPISMNIGLSMATSDWVLFLDDDIRIGTDFIACLKRSIADGRYLAQVGQVVQPWQEPNQKAEPRKKESGLHKDLTFQFNSDQEAEIENCMAGNLCVNRAAAIAAGGFDENFSGAAYRFETEFSRRFCLYHKDKILYSPKFLIHHLHASRGGTRSHDDFLTSSSPTHSEGDYYFALVCGKGSERWRYCVRRLCGSIVAKFYLFKPWFVPVRLLAELRGLRSAIRLRNKGQRLLSVDV